MTTWHSDSWVDFPAAQQPEYNNAEQVNLTLKSIRSAEGIVSVQSIETLLRKLENIYNSNDNSMFLQIGDCAESFESCTLQRIETDSHLFSQLENILSSPFTVGRICGQFAKPRSSLSEQNDLLEDIPSFRGDIINSINPDSRHPSPSRMKTAYSLSKNLYTQKISSSEIFISHECLLLPYEAALVRHHNYSTSAHMLWIGDRTRQINGAHIEFCRGLKNPIGIKVGPSADPHDIRLCVEKLNPENLRGKISVITRYGAGRVKIHLPLLIKNLKGLHVIYQCDPLHGNTQMIGRFKTRHVDSIKLEIQETISTHNILGTRVHALHLEVTGDNVTECVGVNVEPADLPLRYRSACDPRLNPEQAKEIVRFASSLIQSSTPKRETSVSTAKTSAGSSSRFSDEDNTSSP